MKSLVNKILVFSFLLFMVFIFASCQKKEVVKDDYETTISNNLITYDKVEKKKVSLENMLVKENVGTDSEISNIDNDNDIDETDKTNETEKVTETEIVDETKKTDETLNSLDIMVDVDDKVYHKTLDIDTTGWVYGMTPCDWVYIEPNVQIISNYKPNSSKNYSIKSKVSSGLKGCYIPVFCKTDMMSNDFDGRFYCFDDYKKQTPNNMLFNTTLKGVKYKDMTVKEILEMSNEIFFEKDYLPVINGQYVNIIYVTDLDKILNGN